MIRVTALDFGREEPYTRFLGARPEALLYHSLPYRDLLLEHLGCEAEYLVASRGDDVVAVLPLMWHEGVLNSLPYFGSNGGIVGDEPEARTALLAAYEERALDAGTVSATTVANPFDPDPAVPVHTLTDRRIAQATPLTNDRDALLAAIDSSARRNVRKAEKEGVEVAADESAMPALVAIHRDNISALGGLAKEPKFFEAVARTFKPGEEYDVWAARIGDEVVAALLVFYFGQTVEYFTPAVAHDHRSRQPLAAILVEAMAAAAARGYTRWNWGGTWESQTGVFRFKRKWGAQPSEYTYYVQLNDETLLNGTPAELRERFGHFYVLPFSHLKGAS